jgi:hypothetical protein
MLIYIPREANNAVTPISKDQTSVAMTGANHHSGNNSKIIISPKKKLNALYT